MHMPRSSKKRVTIKDIAEMAGTSKTTVSFYLNGRTNRMSEETRKRIEKIIKATGYEPSSFARGLNSKVSKLIGIIVGDMASSFSSVVVKGVEASAREAGYSTIVCSSDFDSAEESACVERLLSLGADGLVIQPSSESKFILDTVGAAGKQFVLFDSKFNDYASSWVKVNDYDSTFQTISSCVERGYRRFLLVSASPKLASARIERFNGFVDALDREGIGFSQLEVGEGAVNADELEHFFSANIDETTPTLVFAPNSWALPGIYAAMSGYFHLMPTTVGLVGFDNFEWSAITSPSVTTIEQPAFEIGEEAFDVLLSQMTGDTEQDPHRVLNCVTQWRESTR